MDDALKRILGLAWRTVPAVEANAAIARARRATAAGEDAARRGQLDAEREEGEVDPEAPMARAYELLLPPAATLESFAREQLPRLVYHLESVGAHLPRPAGVVICLFSGSELHFLQAAELIAAVCRELGLSAEELVARYGTHELRTAIRGDPPSASARASAPAPSGKSETPLALPGAPRKS